MQLGSVRLSTGSEGDGKRVDNALVEHDGSTHYRQVVVLGGASTALGGLDIVEVTSVAPSSDVYALPVRIAANSTGNLIGAVAVSNSLSISSGSVAPTSQWTVTAALAAGSTASVAPTSQWTVTAALAAGSTVSVSGSSVVVAPTSQWTVTAALAAGSTASVAPTSQWTVTAALAAGSTVSVSGSSITAAPTSQWTVTAALAAASTLSVAPTSQWSVTAALAAASTMSVAPTTQWDVRVVGAGSSGVIGASLLSTGLTGAAIDPRQVTLQAGTTALIGAVQSTIVAATSGAGLGTIVSTGFGAAAIDPRLVTLQASSTSILIGVVSLSSAQAGARDPIYSTGVMGGKQINFFSTGFAMGATQAMIALNQVTDGVVTSSSISSYTVTALKNLYVDYMVVSFINSTTASKIGSLVIHVSSSGASSTGAPRMWVTRFATNPGVGVLNSGQTFPFDLNMVIPAGYFFGLSGVASSSGNEFAVQVCAREITQVL